MCPAGKPRGFFMGAGLHNCGRGEDVFAYLLQKNLPIHPMYTRESHQPLEYRRVGGFMSSRNRGAEYGRFVWLREQYPDLWREISTKYPEIKKYV